MDCWSKISYDYPKLLFVNGKYEGMSISSSHNKKQRTRAEIKHFRFDDTDPIHPRWLESKSRLVCFA